LTDTAYLIRATQEDVSIRVAATDTLAPPK
jgi:hypothetical protein